MASTESQIISAARQLWWPSKEHSAWFAAHPTDPRLAAAPPLGMLRNLRKVTKGAEHVWGLCVPSQPKSWTAIIRKEDSVRQDLNESGISLQSKRSPPSQFSRTSQVLSGSDLFYNPKSNKCFSSLGVWYGIYNWYPSFNIWSEISTLSQAMSKQLY